MVALRSVDLVVAPGEVHALLGANGAGKSTMVKILTGVLRADAGTIAIQALDGQKPEKQTLLTPAVWDKVKNEAELKANYFPDRDKTFSSAVTVEPYTTYTPEQLFACKGPGE